VIELNVVIKPGAKNDKVKQNLITGEIEIWTTAKAVDNQVNKKMIKQLAKYLAVNPSRLVLMSGEKCKRKMVLFQNAV
jgi:uncharacterized protein YggU (UPF0235/DUF167 family)